MPPLQLPSAIRHNPFASSVVKKSRSVGDPTTSSRAEVARHLGSVTSDLFRERYGNGVRASVLRWGATAAMSAVGAWYGPRLIEGSIAVPQPNRTQTQEFHQKEYGQMRAWVRNEEKPVLVLSGRPGIGKTTLMNETEREFASCYGDDALVLNIDYGTFSGEPDVILDQLKAQFTEKIPGDACPQDFLNRGLQVFCRLMLRETNRDMVLSARSLSEFLERLEWYSRQTGRKVLVKVDEAWRFCLYPGIQDSLYGIVGWARLILVFPTGDDVPVGFGLEHVQKHVSERFSEDDLRSIELTYPIGEAMRTYVEKALGKMGIVLNGVALTDFCDPSNNLRDMQRRIDDLRQISLRGTYTSIADLYLAITEARRRQVVNMILGNQGFIELPSDVQVEGFQERILQGLSSQPGAIAVFIPTAGLMERQGTSFEEKIYARIADAIKVELSEPNETGRTGVTDSNYYRYKIRSLLSKLSRVRDQKVTLHIFICDQDRHLFVPSGVNDLMVICFLVEALINFSEIGSLSCSIVANDISLSSETRRDAAYALARFSGRVSEEEVSALMFDRG